MACICQRRRMLLPLERTFVTIQRRTISIHQKENLAEDMAELIPEYPFKTNLYRQGQKGLYGGSKLQFGNTTREENKPRARRSWGLNVKRRRLYSEALQRTVQLDLTTRVLRTIYHYGGLDEYLLGEKPARIKALGETGWWLRWAIMQTPAVRKRQSEEQKTLMAALEQQGVLEGAEEIQKAAKDTVRKALQDRQVAAESSKLGRQRYRRITFRTDKNTRVIFKQNEGWEEDIERTDEAAWQRDLATVAELQRRRKPIESELPDLKAAANYIMASLEEKKLRSGMPPSIVSHREWFKKYSPVLNRQAGFQKLQIERPQQLVLEKSLLWPNRQQVAEALKARVRYRAYKPA